MSILLPNLFSLWPRNKMTVFETKKKALVLCVSKESSIMNLFSTTNSQPALEHLSKQNKPVAGYVDFTSYRTFTSVGKFTVLAWFGLVQFFVSNTKNLERVLFWITWRHSEQCDNTAERNFGKNISDNVSRHGRGVGMCMKSFLLYRWSHAQKVSDLLIFLGISPIICQTLYLQFCCFCILEPVSF